MMSLASVSGGSAAASYYSQDNYYTAEQGSEASEWVGKGAEALELKGPVEEQAFVDVLDGKLPNGSEITSGRGEHRAGLDLTFSASKSVSLLAILGGDKRIEAAMRDSVKATLGWVEANLIEARVTDKASGEQVKEKTGNLVAATFLHDVNRNGEPQLHIHSVLANATLASDGKWHAIHNDLLYKNQHLIGAIHNAELRTRIEALGYTTVPAKNPRDGAFEISGVSRDVVEAYSTRRGEIVERLDAEGRSSPKERELVALSTRKAKNESLTPAERMASWQKTADEHGFDAKPLTDAARSNAASRDTVWSKIADGVRGAGAQGMAIAASMGLTPKDGDELVPERLGRLNPVDFAAAQAVASAARELGENEAAYSRNDLILRSLERYGPITVQHVEARIDHLVDRGLLIAGNEMMTKESAVRLEQKVIADAAKGNGAVQSIASGNDVGPRLQASARELGLHRLNKGQEQAGIDILTSHNRVVLIQGSAGTGKSAALAPVAEFARAQGHNVIALSHVGKIADEFGQKVKAPASTVDGFLGKYGRVLDGTASPKLMAEAKQNLTNAVIMVDEASQIGTCRLGRLVDLSNRIDVARLVLAGDIKQLPAIEAGKPAQQLQEYGQQTSHITENLRAQTPQMQALNAALEAKDVARSFQILAPDTIQVEKGKTARAAAEAWASRSPEDRSQTILLASGRMMRSDANQAVQSELKARGELSEHGRWQTVLDRVNIGREGARQLKGYAEGRIVEFKTNLRSQGMATGDRGTVLGIERGKVELLMEGGEIRKFDPEKIPRNVSHDAVAIYQQKAIELHPGDKIRWTERDAERGLYNGGVAEITSINDGIAARGADGREHRFKDGERMLERLDLAYAINVHVAQGITAKDGIILMDSSERMLNSFQTFLVASTRIAEHVSLVIDNAEKLERDIASNPGGKTSAIETAQVAEMAQAKEAELTHELERSWDFEIS
jgi:conjugative relaxase-like TrwC/TraI family protein